MQGDWTAEVVARMHTARITGQRLAAKCGYSAAYLSTVLNGKKEIKDIEATKEKIFEALAKLEKEHQDSLTDMGSTAAYV